MKPIPQVAEEESVYWALLKKGDQSGLRYFYETYVDELFSFGMTLVKCENQVKDAIQEVYLDLWKYREQINSSVNVKLYLYKCLANKVFRIEKESRKIQDLHHAYMRERELLVESAEFHLINFQLDTSLKKSLEKAIDNLPERQKAVITCLFFEEFSYEETSQIMNINLRSTYTLAWKAIGSLKKHLVKSMIILFSLPFIH